MQLNSWLSEQNRATFSSSQTAYNKYRSINYQITINTFWYMDIIQYGDATSWMYLNMTGHNYKEQEM